MAAVFISPKDWTYERLRGWAAGRHQELESMFGAATGRPVSDGEAGRMSDGEREGDMSVYERTLIRALISEANNALMEQDSDEQIVATFLDGVTVQGVTALYREVMRRQGGEDL